MAGSASKKVYTHGHHASVLSSHSWRTAENSASHVLPYLTADQTVLDVGCGPGTITADFAKLTKHVTAIETNDSILEIAAQNASAKGLGDVHKLKYPDGTFDVVHAHQVLQHVSDPISALREMRRVTKPGGIVAVREVDFAGTVWYPCLQGLQEWLALYARVARANGGEPDAGRRLHAWARAAGFEPAKIAKSSSTWTYSTEAEVAWWSNLWAERTLASDFAKTALANRVATKEQLEAVSRTWKEWGTSEDAWFVMLNGEIIARV
ncbi:hypothetical protein HDU87_008576 [Geranomyces variabilis]|uniref:Methyltransferase type 11 domain-containing protein n=1 Tax=Geranomyces variabilis TaxID=109894 RepID=A0AAD5TTT0_9FUNG|nr:hypothetical protein HDU87_008576 [Geranomyces variabilis]